MAKVTPIGLINVLQAKHRELEITEKMQETQMMKSSKYTVIIEAGTLPGL